MNSLDLFEDVSNRCCSTITKAYSTSFSSAILLLRADIRKPIHAIYGMVRLADEIVDTFHHYDKVSLLRDFKRDTFKAIEDGISINPVLNSFCRTVKRYNIDPALVEAFFCSMEMDLSPKASLDTQEYGNYIYGSAEVVGLMCLYVFCNGDKKLFRSLEPYARALGAAFQKVNFLRDLQSDVQDLDRRYFPGFDARDFNLSYKRKLESEISGDFEKAYIGIKGLPLSSKFGVYVAFRYYLALFQKLTKSGPQAIMERRIRISNSAKFVIVIKAGLRCRFNMI